MAPGAARGRGCRHRGRPGHWRPVARTLPPSGYRFSLAWSPPTTAKTDRRPANAGEMQAQELRPPLRSYLSANSTASVHEDAALRLLTFSRRCFGMRVRGIELRHREKLVKEMRRRDDWSRRLSPVRVDK